MLLQFNFKNFKSFLNENSLDMTATKMTDLRYHVIQTGKEKILPAAALFGANASGKSNVFQAFSYMTEYVLRSFQYGGGNDTKQGDESSFTPPPIFAFNKNNPGESSFEVYFIEKESKKTYNYGFSVDKHGVAEEWLNTRAMTSKTTKQIFYRNRKNTILDLMKIQKSHKDNIYASIEDEVLVVSLGAKLKIPICKKVRDWFFYNEVLDYGNSLELVIRSNWLPKNFEDPKAQKAVLRYLSAFDDSIKDFEVEKVPSPEDSQESPQKYKVFSMHKSIDAGDLIGIPLQQESAGTRKMFSLYQQLTHVLSRGSLMFVDELNARLHPLLVRGLVQLFTDQDNNPHGAQLIFTTHDTWHLSNNLLRRDEIWFTDKDPNGLSTLYSLADFVDDDGFKIRKDENYEKNYLLGKYGAIPDMKTIELLFE